MRALAVLPIAIAVGAWDPCTPPLPVEPGTGAGSGASAQRLNQQLRLSGCVAEHAPRAIERGSRAQAKAAVRQACANAVAGLGGLTQAQAAALTDRLVDQEIDFLTKCQD